MYAVEPRMASQALRCRVPRVDCSVPFAGIAWRVRMLMKRSPTVYMECDRCGLPFEPMKGGLCQRCDRILCGADLHGDLLSRWRAALTGRSICVECRAKARA
jgi:hypothetical protein